MSDLMIRVIAVGFAVGGWMYGHKKGYSLFTKSFLALLGVILWVVVAGVLAGLIWPESLP